MLVDNDITVAVAMLEDIAVRTNEGPWYRISPNMARVIAGVLDQANAEQLQRFVGELHALKQRTEVELPGEVSTIVDNLIHSNAERLGIRPPAI